MPDLEPLKAASIEVAKIIKKGATIVYESTVYPGVTEEVCIPLIENVTGLKYNQDFFIGYSPERISPSDKTKTLENVVKSLVVPIKKRGNCYLICTPLLLERACMRCLTLRQRKLRK